MNRIEIIRAKIKEMIETLEIINVDNDKLRNQINNLINILKRLEKDV